MKTITVKISDEYLNDIRNGKGGLRKIQDVAIKIIDAFFDGGSEVTIE